MFESNVKNYDPVFVGRREHIRMTEKTGDICINVPLCVKCGVQFNHTMVKAGDTCPLCLGIIKEYDPEFPAAINLLDRMGHKVRRYVVAKETDTSFRFIYIGFEEGQIFFTPIPKGFVVRYDKENPSLVTHIIKRYRKDMSIYEYARRLTADKAALYEWVHTLALRTEGFLT